MKRLLYIFALGIGLFSACKKGTLVESTVYEKIEPGSTKYAYLKFLNVSPGSPLINFYVNGSKFSGAYTSLGTENNGLGYKSYFPGSGFATTTPGTQTLSASTLASDKVFPGLQIFSNPISPEAGKYYSIVLAGVYDSTARKIPNFIVLSEARPALDTTKIYVRLVNLFNGSPNIDMTQASNGQKIITNAAFAKVTDWVSIPNAGQLNTYTFSDSATGLVFPKQTIPALTKGRAYTFYAAGVNTGKTYPFVVGYSAVDY